MSSSISAVPLRPEKARFGRSEGVVEMKIRIHGHEIEEPQITQISLVKRGVNRSPFKIIKSSSDEDETAAPARDVRIMRGGFGHSLDDLEADVRGRRDMAEKY